MSVNNHSRRLPNPPDNSHSHRIHLHIRLVHFTPINIMQSLHSHLHPPQSPPPLLAPLYHQLHALRYTLFCSSNLPPLANPSLMDIQQIQSPDVFSIYSCIDACALYNYQIPMVAFLAERGLDVPFGRERFCAAVSYGQGMGGGGVRVG